MSGMPKPTHPRTALLSGGITKITDQREINDRLIFSHKYAKIAKARLDSAFYVCYN